MSAENPRPKTVIEMADRICDAFLGRPKASRSPVDLILGYLEEHPDSTGMEIGSGLSFGPATVYPILFCLEEEGRVQSDWRGDRRPRPRQYRIREEVAVQQ